MPALSAEDEAREALPALRKAALAAEIVAAYMHVRWLLARRDLPSALTELRDGVETPGGPPLGSHRIGRRLGRAVVNTLSVLPADSRCLMRSLVLTRVLARRGIPTTLIISVRPGPELVAHAWVEHSGRPLLPPGDIGDKPLVEL
jgi:Transglutaminase-like superfamily